PSASTPTGSMGCSVPTRSRRCDASSAGSCWPSTAESVPRRCEPSWTWPGRRIVLDPGHGGEDTGTIAHGLTESEVTLDLARRIEGRLSAIGATVLFTRSATTGPDDLSRAMMANQAGADIVLSLHCDGTDHP